MTFLAHLQKPKHLVFKDTKGDKNYVYITDGQSSSLFEALLYNINERKVYYITPGWQESLLSLFGDVDSFKEFKNEYDYLFDRYKVDLPKKKKLLLPPFSNMLSEDDDEAYQQIKSGVV